MPGENPMIRSLIAATLAIALSACATTATAGSLTITGAAGEFENRIATQRYTVEIRHPIAGPAYAVGVSMQTDHPRPEIDDRVMGGLGYHWRGWDAELIGDDDRYLASLMYTAPTETWELRGGVLHGNRWQEGFKQTGLKVSVGYPLGPVTVGGFYEIGNTTMRSVDDLYGGYLRWEW